MWLRLSLLLALVVAVLAQPPPFGRTIGIPRWPQGNVPIGQGMSPIDETAGRTLGRRRAPPRGMEAAGVDSALGELEEEEDAETEFEFPSIRLSNLGLLLRFTRTWPSQSRLAAIRTQRKYGAPTIATRHFLVWEDVAPFKYIIVYRTGTRHNHPSAHTNIVEHVISYRTPVTLADDLLRFYGAAVVKRNEGELSVKSRNERLNTALLNLANEIVTGEKNWREARREYVQIYFAELAGEPSEYGDELQFETQSPILARDPDMPERTA